jgi:uracil-DNA glycosylase
VTDVYKLFYRLEEPINKKSNSDFDFIELETTLHFSILNNEIETIKPKAIITLGNNSRNTLLNHMKIKTEKWDDIQLNYWQLESNTKLIPLISIPHISGAANGTSSLILKKYPGLTGTKNEKLAKLVHLKLKNFK